MIIDWMDDTSLDKADVSNVSLVIFRVRRGPDGTRMRVILLQTVLNSWLA